MRLLWGLLALTGCHGTVLAQLETGYEYGPRADASLHGGSLAAHLGGSTTPGLGIGATVRTRAWSDGWAFPEFGPHAFVFFENDTPVAFYARTSVTGGLAGIGGELGPVFTGTLSPGVILYVAEEAIGLSLSGVFAVHGAPVGGHTQVWFGVRVGVMIGGVAK